MARAGKELIRLYIKYRYNSRTGIVPLRLDKAGATIYYELVTDLSINNILVY